MKTGFVLSALMLAGAAASGLARATPPVVDVAIKGSIKPAITCIPSIAENRLDYGDIATNDLIKDKVTILNPKPVRLNVKCTNNTKLSIQFVDSKQASATTEAIFIRDVQQQGLPGVTADHAFGLGTFGSDAGPKNIGSLFLSIDPDTGIGADGASMTLLSNSHGAGWIRSPEHFLKDRGTGLRYSFGDYSNARPVSVRDMDMAIRVTPAINSKQLDFKSEVNLDGKVTIEIRQL
jgi:hypothetical protein